LPDALHQLACNAHVKRPIARTGQDVNMRLFHVEAPFGTTLEARAWRVQEVIDWIATSLRSSQ
jgi:hypothetical protein